MVGDEAAQHPHRNAEASTSMVTASGAAGPVRRAVRCGCPAAGAATGQGRSGFLRQPVPVPGDGPGGPSLRCARNPSAGACVGGRVVRGAGVATAPIRLDPHERCAHCGAGSPCDRRVDRSGRRGRPRRRGSHGRRHPSRPARVAVRRRTPPGHADAGTGCGCVDGSGFDTALPQLPGQSVRAVLGADEEQCSSVPLGDLRGDVDLVRGRHSEGPMRHRAG